jgi:hypothetical protein
VRRRITVLTLCAVAALGAGSCRHDSGLYPVGATPGATLATAAEGIPTATPRGSGGPAQARPTATPPRATATRAVPRTPDPGVGPLVVYRRSGGIAGLDDEMAVERDGAYRISRRGAVVARGHLSGGDLDRLRRTLLASDFRAIPVASLHQGADLMTYVVSYDGYAVTAMDLAVPARLAPVLTVLDDLFARYAG